MTDLGYAPYQELVMDKEIYKPRLVDKQVELELETFGAVCIEDAKLCGKTWTSK
jgi:hypothetical protein